MGTPCQGPRDKFIHPPPHAPPPHTHTSCSGTTSWPASLLESASRPRPPGPPRSDTSDTGTSSPGTAAAHVWRPSAAVWASCLSRHYHTRHFRSPASRMSSARRLQPRFGFLRHCRWWTWRQWWGVPRNGRPCHCLSLFLDWGRTGCRRRRAGSGSRHLKYRKQQAAKTFDLFSVSNHKW